MSEPKISVVTAMFNAEPYVAQMLGSVALQTIDRSAIEVIIIDDGSSDNSVAVARSEMERLELQGCVVEQSHERQAVARNRGIDIARGEWISFLDSDDWINPEYFERLLALENEASRAGFDVEILVAHTIEHHETTGRNLDLYPLAWRFGAGDMVVDLDKDPNYINLQCGPMFVKRDLFTRTGIRFDPRVQPTYEDASLFNLLLLECDRPLVGYSDSAVYFYRKRVGSSVADAWKKPGRYDDILRFGQQPLIEKALETRGEVPGWITANILYDQGWALYANDELNSRTDWLSDSQREQFCILLKKLFRHSKREDLWSPYFAHVDAEMRAAILAASQGIYREVNSYQRDQDPKFPHLDKLTYRYALESKGIPREELIVDGKPAVDYPSGTHCKTYFGNIGYCERTIFVPAGSQVDLIIEQRSLKEVESLVPKLPMKPPRAHPLVRLARQRQGWTKELQFSAQKTKKKGGRFYRAVKKDHRTRWLLFEIRELLALVDSAWVPSSLSNRLARKFSWWPNRSRKLPPSVSRKYLKRIFPEGSWVLYDSYERADDNAEHLARYLLTNRPDVSVVYVLDRESKDWSRLEAEGFPLVPPDTRAAIHAIKNAAVVLSSHADVNKERPIARFKRPGPRKVPFVFLQHGVTKDDLSQWLNPKDIDYICCGTRDEFDTFTTSDRSPYINSTLSAGLTGFPRWDSLVERKAAAVSTFANGKRDRWITLVPTWRRDLAVALGEIDDMQQRQQLFLDSDYLSPWREILQDVRLRGCAKQNGLKLQLIVHPALSRLLDLSDFSSDLELKTYEDIAIQQVLVDSAYVITDNSSVAFDAAYIGVNIVYLQDDVGEIYSGGHMYRKGYFDYVRDGFGPVVRSSADLVQTLLLDIESGVSNDLQMPSHPRYKQRASHAFGDCRGDNAARVVGEVELLLERRG